MRANDSGVVNPGAMRHRIVLQQASVTRNTDGSERKTWPDTATVSAAIAFGTGRELFAARAVNAELTHLITIRYYAGLGPDWRVKFNDPKDGSVRYFDIRSIEAVGTMRRHQRLQCRELVGRQVQT